MRQGRGSEATEAFLPMGKKASSYRGAYKGAISSLSVRLSVCLSVCNIRRFY